MFENSSFRMLEVSKISLNLIFEHSNDWKIEFSNDRTFEGSHFRVPDHVKTRVLECSSLRKLAFSSARVFRSSLEMLELLKDRIFEPSND